MSRKVYYEKDVDSKVLEGKKVAVIGYGAQGRAQARMMHESGIDVVVGVRESGKSWNQVKEDGLEVAPIKEAAKQADIIHILIPDEVQKQIYKDEIEEAVTEGKVLSFSHGFSIVFKAIVPPEGVGVIMVAPKSPGTEEYKRYKEGFGVPALVSVHQENSQGNAKDIALAMANEMHFTKAGAMECTFAEEAEEDLFGEQAVLCGGMAELIKAGFETLTEAGYPPEFAYYECLHECKLIVDLIYEGGLGHMYDVVSNTAEYGGRTRGPRVITSEVKANMKEILKEVQDGRFATEWLKEAEENSMANLLKMRTEEANHPIEKVGKEIRDMFKKD